ncbi:hypothetical protein [Variovorax ureilyticus]|uniref:hypothetical protein n=1 Tax=Variovorax ureilyticus TaxID=1836198 RepID=UPI003BF4BB6F
MRLRHAMEIRHPARRIEAWRHGRQVADAHKASSQPAPRLGSRDVFCYFDNDSKVSAPFDAADLACRLGVPIGLGGGA